MSKGFAGTSIAYVIKNAGKHPVSDDALQRLAEITGNRYMDYKEHSKKGTISLTKNLPFIDRIIKILFPECASEDYK